MINKIRIQRFKSVDDLELELGPITALVGPNNAGKSSVLQAIQFATSVCQSLELDSVSKWQGNIRSGTLSSEQLIYTPLRDVHALARGGSLKQDKTIGIEITLNAADGQNANILVSRGKNRNISCRVRGKAIGTELQDLTQPFSVVAPGMAGIPAVEEFRPKGIVRRAAARGDANSVFRNVLLALSREVAAWEAFHSRLREVFPGLTIHVSFDEDNGETIAAEAEFGDIRLPIDSLGTGVLQAIQILAYIGLYNPHILILDEPDSHLHPNNQRKLVHLLGSLAHQTGVQVILSTHSRNLLDELSSIESRTHWISDGRVREEKDYDYTSGLLDLGALDAGDRLRNGGSEFVVITEDTRNEPLENLLIASGIGRDRFDIWSYGSSSKLESAILLTKFILDVAPGSTVIVHRDRDYLTKEQLERYRRSLQECGGFPFVTEGTDVESHYISASHLSEAFGLSLDQTRALIDNATEACRDESIRRMINDRTVAAQRSRTKSGSNSIDYGRIAKDCREDYESDPARFRHGKTTLKWLMANAQNSFGVNVNPTKLCTPHLAISELVNLAVTDGRDAR